MKPNRTAAIPLRRPLCRMERQGEEWSEPHQLRRCSGDLWLRGRSWARKALVQPRRALWTMPLVHSSHSCTICRQPRSPRCAFPPDTGTCLQLRPERPRPPRRLRCPRSLFVALSQHAAKSRPRRPSPRLPRWGKKERTKQPQRRGKREWHPTRQRGAAASFNYRQAKEGAAAQEDNRRGAGLGNREGWSMSLRREERRAHWTEPVGRTRRSAGLRSQTRDRAAAGTWEEGEGAGMQDLGREGRTDGPESLGRRVPRGVGGAGRRARRARARKPQGRHPGGLSVRLQFGAGGFGSERPPWGRVVRDV